MGATDCDMNMARETIEETIQFYLDDSVLNLSVNQLIASIGTASLSFLSTVAPSHNQHRICGTYLI